MSGLTPPEILARIPQKRPMLFVDEIVEVDDEHILANYTWKEEDCEGHFPGNPIVPGVKLLEMAAQVGCVSWGIYHLAATTSAEEIAQIVGFFTEIEEGKFKKMVRPGEKVIAQAVFEPDGYFRSNKLVAHVEIQFDGGPKDGETIFTGRTSSLWLPKSSESIE